VPGRLWGGVVSRQDPGGATGKSPYDLARCVCGCLSSLHKPHDVTAVLGACSSSNCDCRRFTEEATDA
jgi:hypothetical protein